MRHTVPTAPVMEAVDRDGILDAHLAELVGFHDGSTVSKLRARPTLPFETADRILIAVNSEHLWHTDPTLAGHYAPPTPKPRPKAPRRPSGSAAYQRRLVEELDVLD